MGIDDLKARLDQLVNDLRGGTARQQAGILHEALVDLKVALKDLTGALERTERELASEREQLAAADRRGRLAADIDDQETAELARQYGEKHRQRVDLLERKLGVQRDELALTQQEYDGLSERYRAARQGVPSGDGPPPRVTPELTDDLLDAKMDRRAAEAAAEAQLEMLKKKMGKG
ncbi:MAG: hypothetical protein AB7S39_16310 [Gemmatimonadales bacterium]